MSNRFKKYCLGLSTRGGDRRPLSRGRRRHRLMFAEGGPACGKPDLRVLFALVCAFPRVHTRGCAAARLWGGLGVPMGLVAPDTAGADPCPAPRGCQPRAGSGVPGGCSSLRCAATLQGRLLTASVNDIHPISPA